MKKVFKPLKFRIGVKTNLQNRKVNRKIYEILLQYNTYKTSSYVKRTDFIEFVVTQIKFFNGVVGL